MSSTSPVSSSHPQHVNNYKPKNPTSETEPSPAGDMDGVRESIHLQVDGDATIFEPRSTIEVSDSIISSWGSLPAKPAVRAPEKKLTLFALRLAVLEKAATGLGTLGFIWATVVLLGGLAITLDKTDFWSITIILAVEGTRIFGRSQELEWQHQATWSLAGDGSPSSHFVVETMTAAFQPIDCAFQKQSRCKEVSHPAVSRRNWRKQRNPTRTWESSDVPLLPYAPWVFLSRNVSRLLHWVQIAAATACAVLSLMKLIKHNYGEVAKGDSDKGNRQAALSIFYALALAEALLFLLEKAYWEWQISYCRVLEEVNEELGLGPSGMVSIRRFFYDSYSKSVNGSIFDGLKMDMVSFGMDLLASNSPDEQLIGVRILHNFAIIEKFTEDTLQKIGITMSVMERLVEMLNWEDPEEEEIRISAAEILSKLASKKQNTLRVAGIAGAMESIASLLQNSNEENCNHLGLLILEKLARDHDICGKIGNTRGLLGKIIGFTHVGEILLKNETDPSQILTVKRSLQVLKMLASTTGTTGKKLRREISEAVFTISNIRDILRNGERHPLLQQLGIEILTRLAMEEEATERIGDTGGVLTELFKIFFKQGIVESQSPVRVVAGEALAMLAVESKRNCHRMLKLKVVEALVEALEAPMLRINAARVLTNLCTFSGAESFSHLRGVFAAAPTVLRSIMKEDNKLQEVMVGLAAQIFKFMTPQESKAAFNKSQILEAELASVLVQILKKNQCPQTSAPRTRRFVLELAIWMMRNEETNVQIFSDLGMKEELECLVETTSELESFNVFSGTVGLSRHIVTIHSLVETATKLLEEE